MKTSVLIVFIALSTLNLTAQYAKGQSAGHHATGDVNILKSALKLTNEQTEKVTQIYITHYKSTDSLSRIIMKRGLNPEAINSAQTIMRQTMQLETDKKITSLLNNDQKRAYAEFISHRRPGRMIQVVTPAPK